MSPLRRPLVELIVAVIASTLIGFGLTQIVTDLGWEVAIGLGLLLMAALYLALPREIASSPVAKVALLIAGIVLILLPNFRI